MTYHEIEALTPVVESLQRSGVISTYATTSWPADGADYDHAFWITAPGLSNRLLVPKPFDEDGLVHRIASALARENHHTAVITTLTMAGDRLLDDLAGLYAQRLRGKAIPIPAQVTIKDITVPIS